MIFLSYKALLLSVCLLCNELLNASFKRLGTWILGKARLLQRPSGAADSGIYPQHFPKVSTSTLSPTGDILGADSCSPIH